MPAAPLPRDVLAVGEGFWNLRGSFKIAGLLDVGTHASLVRRSNGRYLLLDACGLKPEVRQWLAHQVGDDLEAILHLHPFHTVYAREVHELYPRAALYGTARHHVKLADLPWNPLRTEDPALAERFADDLLLSVPRGVEFVPANERLHFASVLAFHPSSRTLHVDDTLVYAKLPGPLRLLGRDVLRLHPSLAHVLERRTGATQEFREWADEIVERAREIRNLCAAHTHCLLETENAGAPIAERIREAVKRADRILAAHEQLHG